MRIIYLLSVSLLLFSSCDDSRLYENNVEFNDRYWYKDSIATFDFEISDVEKPYNLYFTVRNTNNYTFHNLYIQYSLRDSVEGLEQDLKNFYLFDEKTGEPFGSGLGDLFSHQFKLLENYQFSKKGTYTIDIQHYMREDSLKGIVSAGTRVEHVSVED